MKKLKILTVFGVLLAMGITACNKGGDNGGGEDVQSQETPVSQSADESQHTHEYGEWHETKAPTCTAKGEEQRECACGDVQTRPVNAKGHTWGEWSEKTAATCTVDGVEERNCQVAGCDGHEERAIKAAHKFGTETDVTKTGTKDIDYKTAVCSVDNALKISFPTEVGGVYTGTSRKSNTPTGYTKLSGNGSISWTLNLAGDKGYLGKMYHMACMDAYSSNSEKNYGYYTTSGSSTRAEGNFKFYVNGKEADKSAYMEISFEDLTKDGEVDPELEKITSSPGPYSPVALCPLGDNVYVGPGENVFKYERTGSYNMVMRELVFIGVEYNHTHNNSETEWASNETQHWHACTNPGCPLDGKVGAANHTLVEVKPADDTSAPAGHQAKAATCSEEGLKVEVCSVCQYRKETKLNKLPHTLGEPHDIVAATCAATGSQKRTCSVCSQEIDEVLPKAAHSFGDPVEKYAAVTEGDNQYVATKAYNCSGPCNTSALRWSALDYDKTLSSGTSDVKVNGSATNNAVKTGAAENDGGSGNANPAVSVGNHYVYKVNLAAAAENVGLAFQIFSRSDDRQVFKAQSNDGKNGNYYDSTTQKFTAAPARYGVRINNEEVYFNQALLDAEEATPKNSLVWRDFPLNSFSLKAGINTIDVYSMAGYSQAGILEFQITGLPKVTPTHTHNGGDAWLNDADNHWHVCTETEGCPLDEGGIYAKAAHTWGEPYDVVPATCSAKGSYKVKCTVCQLEKSFETDKLEHEWVGGEVTVVSGAKGQQTLTCSNCAETKTVTGGIYDTFKWSDAKQSGNLSSGKFADGVTYEFRVFNVPAAGTYVLTLNMKGSNGNGSKVCGESGQGFEVKANGAAATFLGNGKTYAEFIGEDQTAWTDVAFAEVTLQAGTNVITIKPTNGYNRLSPNESGNMSLAPKAAA